MLNSIQIFKYTSLNHDILHVECAAVHAKHWQLAAHYSKCSETCEIVYFWWEPPNPRPGAHTANPFA